MRFTVRQRRQFYWLRMRLKQSLATIWTTFISQDVCNPNACFRNELSANTSIVWWFLKNYLIHFRMSANEWENRIVLWWKGNVCKWLNNQLFPFRSQRNDTRRRHDRVFENRSRPRYVWCELFWDPQQEGYWTVSWSRRTWFEYVRRLLFYFKMETYKSIELLAIVTILCVSKIGNRKCL